MQRDKDTISSKDLIDANNQISSELKIHTTLREFIKCHQNDCFDMITPDGYVYLTPEYIKLLISGNSVKGHLGCSSNDIEIASEELLDQEITDISFNKGTWYILSNHVCNQENEQTISEQGVNMY